MGETVPVGYRFHPTEEELVGHYLKYKLLGDDSRVQNIIAEVDFRKYEPWDLPAFSKVKSDDPEWFFFRHRDLKYATGSRSNRLTPAGYWKVTGKDRDIKTRDTGNVIGTKKTLVFYKGRVPRGVKTNWVIHEYHAVTFPVDKRTFVLCHLKEKAEKKSEGRTDELINEEELIAADHENDRIPDIYTLLPEVTLESIFPSPPQADEYDFPSMQYPSIVTDLEPFHHSSNPFDTTEDEGNFDFLNSILVDEDGVSSEERRDAFVNGFSQSRRQVYYGSSETDAELVTAQYDNIVSNTSACKHAVSSGFQVNVIRMVDTPEDVVYAGSSKTEVNQDKKDSSTIGDNFWGADISGDSPASKLLSMSVIESSSSSSPPTASFSSNSRSCKTKYHPTPDNYVSRRAAPRRSQTQRKVSSKAVSQHEGQKEIHIPESSKYQRQTQDARSRKSLETTNNHLSSVNRKVSFIDMQTPPISHNPNPRSVYLVNVIVGFSLLIIAIWEMVSFGKLR